MCDKNKHRVIGFEIKKVSNLIRRNIDETIAESEDREKIEITGMQSWIIGYIYDNWEDKDLFQRDIENEFKIRRSTATGMLGLLEKNGFIKRVPVSHDGRLKKLVLTDKAVEHHKRIEEKIKLVNENIEKNISDEERDIFFKILDKIRTNIEK